MAENFFRRPCVLRFFYGIIVYKKERVRKVRMKLCPICGVNVIKDEEEKCVLCGGSFANPKKIVPTKVDMQSALVKIKDIEGQTVYANTHAEFLNTVFGTNYERWMKSIWKYSESIFVWMIRLYDSDGEWRNRREGAKITEEYLGRSGIWNGRPIDLPVERCKIVVSIEDRGYRRSYTVLGLYKLIEEESTKRKRVYGKVYNA